jgi:hypothetical protein
MDVTLELAEESYVVPKHILFQIPKNVFLIFPS